MRASLNRYHVWLSRLSEAERNEIRAAPTLRERLHIIKRIRNQQWEARLPQKDRDRLNAEASPEKRHELALQIRREELLRRDEWKVGQRFWTELMNEEPLPSQPADFPPEVQTYLKDCVMPLLGEEEEKRLTNAEGHWPLYPRTLVELSDRHPLTLPPP